MNLHPAHVANRYRAVIAMLSELPNVHTSVEVEAQADVLERFTAPQRACWAEQCGVKSEPSGETWTLLVQMARLRKPQSGSFLRVVRPS